MPSTVERGALEVGRDLALTPGVVVYRDSMRNSSSTGRRPILCTPVRSLIVPPPIGTLLLPRPAPRTQLHRVRGQPGIRSSSSAGVTPAKEQRDWDLDTTPGRVLSAVDAARDITGSRDVNMLGFCAGGILIDDRAQPSRRQGDDRVHGHLRRHAARLRERGTDRCVLSAADARPRPPSSQDGLITGQALGKVFTWMRPNDLVWNYWVNNYLLGNDPPVFDILAWNADAPTCRPGCTASSSTSSSTTRCATPGAMTVLGTPVDLGAITVPTRS